VKLKEIAKLLNADVLCGDNHLEDDIECACGSDMMSEVLAFAKYHAVLLTGLVNNHVLRTAEMLDIFSIIFVRGKRPSAEIIEMAQEMDIALLSTEMPMFSSCGELYMKGIKGGMRVEANG